MDVVVHRGARVFGNWEFRDRRWLVARNDPRGRGQQSLRPLLFGAAVGRISRMAFLGRSDAAARVGGLGRCRDRRVISDAKIAMTRATIDNSPGFGQAGSVSRASLLCSMFSSTRARKRFGK